MRKTLALFTAALIIFLSLYFCAFAWVNSEKENVTVREAYTYGDKSLTEKADIGFKVRYYDNLLWDIRYDMSEGKAETELSLYRKSIPNTYTESNYFSFGSNFWNYSTSGGSGHTSYFEKVFNELAESATPYEKADKVISVSDYLDYYPISVEASFSDKYIDTSLDYYNLNEKQLVSQLQDFFRIPVLKNHLLTISVTVDENGNIFESGSSSLASSEENPIYDEFSLYANSVITEDKCLIYFSNKTYNGKNADMSEIPGGYGIYCLPYSYSENGDKVFFDGEKLSNVFPVNNNHEIIQLKLSESGNHIYMITDEGSDCFLTVLDADTYQTLQKIKVSTAEGQTAGINYTKSDFAVVNLYHEYLDAEFTLYTLDDKGLFTKQFTSPVYLETEDTSDEENTLYIGAEIYENSEADAEWDGEYLYITNRFSESLFTTNIYRAGFSMGIYNRDGLQFYGNYDTSLSSGFDGLYGSSYYAMLSRNDIIDISLK